MNPRIVQLLNKIVSLGPDGFSVTDAYELESILERDGYKKLPYGGRDNQLSAIENTSSSSVAAKERITNAMDATLEAIYTKCNLPTSTSFKTLINLVSPIVGTWTPDQKVKEIDPPEIIFNVNGITDKSAIRLSRRQPESFCNFVIIDHGVGLDRDGMKNTILSLNCPHKLSIESSTGQFGHGSGGSYKYCDLTLICSVSRFKNEKTFSFTLVKPETDPINPKQGVIYKYFVDSDGFPLSIPMVDIKCTIFTGGTIVAHFLFDRGDWITDSPQRYNSIFGRIEYEFFSFPIPVNAMHYGILKESTRKSGSFFSLKGKRHQIRKSIDRAKERVIEIPSITFDAIDGNDNFGKVTVNAWFFKNREGGDSGKIVNFAPSEFPTIYTLRGQRHGRDSKYHLEKNIEKDMIVNRLLVEVVLDDLDQEGRKYVISPDRERLKDGSLTGEIQKKVWEYLKNSPELKKLNDEEALKKNSISNDDLNREITQEINRLGILEGAETFEDGEVLIDIGGVGQTRPVAFIRRHPSSSLQPMPHNDPPTILDIYDVPNNAVLHQGQSRRIRFRTDARSPAYSFNNKLLQATVSKNGSLRSVTEISPNGYGSITIDCPMATNVGDIITVEIILQSTNILRSAVSFIVGDPIPPVEEEVGPVGPKTNFKFNFYTRKQVEVEHMKSLLAGKNIHDEDHPSFESFKIINMLPTFKASRSENDLIINVNASHPKLVDFLEKTPAAKRGEAVHRICSNMALHAAYRNLKFGGISSEAYLISQKAEEKHVLLENALHFFQIIKLLEIID